MTEYKNLPPIFQGISTAAQTGVAPSPSPISAQQEKQAADVISDLSAKYPSWAMQDINRLKLLFNDANSIAGDARTKMIKNDLYPIAHDMKGQGATFGYPLITDIAAAICAVIKASFGEFDGAKMAYIHKRIHAMERILNENLSGNGGRAGAEIIAHLNEDDAE